MPINYKNYPKNWKLISKRIRTRSASDDGIVKCELCGAENYKPHPYTNSKVIITVHHIIPDLNNNSDENLIALCQRCHLRLDLPLKLAKRQKSNEDKS